MTARPRPRPVRRPQMLAAVGPALRDQDGIFGGLPQMLAVIAPAAPAAPALDTMLDDIEALKRREDIVLAVADLLTVRQLALFDEEAERGDAAFVE